MNKYVEPQTQVADDLWRAWVEKGRKRDAASARNFKVFSAVLVTVLIAGIAGYLLR